MVVANNKIDAKKSRQTDNDFDDHADAAVPCGAHRLMKFIQGFTWSHWMPPSGEFLHRIAMAAAMVDDFGWKHKTLTKNDFLLATYVRPKPKPGDNFGTRSGPFTHLINTTSFINMWDAMIGAEELANISSYQTLWGDKKYKNY